MTTYVEPSALVAVYVTERFSDAARASVRAAGTVPFTALHQLEVSNAFEPSRLGDRGRRGAPLTLP